MERNHSELRVWDRVQGKTCAFRNTAAVAALYMEERQWAARYEALGKRELSGNSQKAADSLRGIYILLTETKPCEPPRERITAPCASVLRRAYVEGLKRKAAYEKWKEDPEYGTVFTALAKAKEAECQNIAEEVGKL